jgi:hypothetical protein
VLEFTFAFGIIALFFLLYYFKLDKEHKEFDERNAEYATPFIDQLTKFNSLAIAILSLFVMFYFAMLGEATVTTTIANNITNYTSIVMVVNGPNALNVTNQTLPAVANFTRVTTTAYSNDQQAMITGAYTVMQYFFLLTALIYGTTLVVRFVQAERDKWKRRREGDYD